MNKKLTYEQPSCDLFVVKFEEGFLQASTMVYGDRGAAGANATYNKYDEDF